MYFDPSRITTRAHSFRRSSWDHTGKNDDYLVLQPGDRVLLLDEDGPGRVTHFYWTTIDASIFHFRQLLLRAWWDEERTPSIEVPLGDLFCVPHCTPANVQSMAVVVNPGDDGALSWGMNLYLPMPFSSRARFELTYDVIPEVITDPIRFWYHIEIEKYDDPLPRDLGRFHAQWRRENPTTPKLGTDRDDTLWNGTNLDGAENYVALDAQGRGHMIGLHLQVDNIGGGWYGEGDDMVFVDGAPGTRWPPTYPGTGTEEIFGGGAGPNQPYSGPYTGFHMVECPDHNGKNAMYRWYLADPIRFEHSLIWTIEHGHDNNYSNDYTSVAFWYQEEPHAAFPQMLPPEQRLPRFSSAVLKADRERMRCLQHMMALIRNSGADREAFKGRLVQYQAAIRKLKQGALEQALLLFGDIR